MVCKISHMVPRCSTLSTATEPMFRTNCTIQQRLCLSPPHFFWSVQVCSEYFSEGPGVNRGHIPDLLFIIITRRKKDLPPLFVLSTPCYSKIQCRQIFLKAIE